MYEAKIGKDIRCPLEHGLDLFGGKWKSRIICVLSKNKLLRYSAIRDEMENITDAVLANALKELILHEIIERTQYNEIPPRVEYSLTEKGRSVIPILQSICDWSLPFHEEEDEKMPPYCRHCHQSTKNRPIDFLKLNKVDQG